MKTYIKAVIGVLAVGLSSGGTYLYAQNHVSADSTPSETVKTEENKASVSEADMKSGSGETEKEETVYIIADANGAPTKTIVSDRLKNPSASAKLEDISELKDIVNVKGYEDYTAAGESIECNADRNDI